MRDEEVSDKIFGKFEEIAENLYLGIFENSGEIIFLVSGIHSVISYETKNLGAAKLN